MKLSDVTQKVLANFATINPSLWFTPGKVLKTISPNKTIIAIANIEEDFGQDFGVYNLSRFLSIFSLLKDPELDLHEKFGQLISGRQVCNYTWTDKTMIITPPAKDIAFPKAKVEFLFTAENLQAIMKAVGVLGAPDVVIVAKDGKLLVSATDNKNSTADHFDIEVGDDIDEELSFKVILKAENLKLLPAEYTVSLAQGIVRFVSPTVTYFLASEAESTLR